MPLQIRIPLGMATTHSTQEFETFDIRPIQLRWTPRATDSSVPSKQAHGRRKQRDAVWQNIRQIEKKLALLKLNVSNRKNSKTSIIRTQQTVKKLNFGLSCQSELQRYNDNPSADHYNHINNDNPSADQYNHINNDNPSADQYNHIYNDNPSADQYNHIYNDNPSVDEYNHIYNDNPSTDQYNHINNDNPNPDQYNHINNDNPSPDQYNHIYNDNPSVDQYNHIYNDNPSADQYNHINNDNPCPDQYNHIYNDNHSPDQYNHIYNDNPSADQYNHIYNDNIIKDFGPYDAQVNKILGNDKPCSEECNPMNPIHNDNLIQVAEQSDAHVNSILRKDNPGSEQLYHNHNDQVKVSEPSDRQVNDVLYNDDLRSEQCNHIQNDKNDETGSEQSNSDQSENAIKDSGPSNALVTDVLKDNHSSDQPGHNRHNQLAKVYGSSYSQVNKDKSSSKPIVIRNEYFMTGSRPSSETVGEENEEDKPKLKFHEMRRKNGKIKKEYKEELKRKHQEEFLAKIKPKGNVAEPGNSNSSKQVESRKKAKKDKLTKLALRKR